VKRGAIRIRWEFSFFFSQAVKHPQNDKRRERRENSDMCAPDDQTEEGVFGTEGINAVTNNENRHRTEKEEKKKRWMRSATRSLPEREI
jgi:hypothetical protein